MSTNNLTAVPGSALRPVRPTTSGPWTWPRQWAAAAWQLGLRHRFWILAVSHVAVFATAYWVAHLLRFDVPLPEAVRQRMWITLPLVLIGKLAVFHLTGQYQGWWCYVTLADLWSLCRATMIATFLLIGINHYCLSGFIPRTIIVLDALVTTMILGAMRASWRTLREQWLFARGPRSRSVALMVGTEQWNNLLARQLHCDPELAFRVAGFLDPEARHQGMRLAGIPVLGTMDELDGIAARYGVTHVLVVADALESPALRSLMDACERNRLKLKIVPSVARQLADEQPIAVRDVEINDLLRRDAVELDLSGISREIAGSTVLVTGAGGSIGSEICRQLIRFRPRRLLLVDHGENCLFLVHHELTSLEGHPPILPYVADIRDAAALRTIFEQWRPDYVFHAAAHKHVGLMEHNVAACIGNNVVGTKRVADVAVQFGVQKFILISTDKAVNPTSVMGASKHLCERYVHSMAQQSQTAFIVVRFGNVLGSNGSVVPIFVDQIRRGGPITITDERMTRFFMTIPEAAQLVLQAAAMGNGGEIFVLEMGEQIPVVELARDLVRLSGLPVEAIPIRVVGVRPGEKLFEELYAQDEEPAADIASQGPRRVSPSVSMDEVKQHIDRLQEAMLKGDAAARDVLRELIPEFRQSLPPRPCGQRGPVAGLDEECLA